MSDVFDRWQNEPEDAWSAFQRYRDIPNPRPSLDSFAGATGYPSSRVKAWWASYDWGSRLVSWDRVVDGHRQGATLRGVEEMAARHIDIAKKGLEAVGLAISKILGDLKSNDFTRLKPHEIARLFEVCAKMERLSRGEVTDLVGEGRGKDYSGLTDDELAFLDRIDTKSN